MKYGIEWLQLFAEKCELLAGMKSGDFLLDELYQSFAEHKNSDAEEMKKLFARLERITENLPFEQADMICTVAVSLCAEQGRECFIAGLRMGAQIVLELLGVKEHRPEGMIE